MATLTVNLVSMTAPITALSNIYESVDGAGDVVTNDGKTWLVFRNGIGGGAATVTAISAATLRGLTVQDPTITIAEDEQGVFGPFPAALFNNTVGQIALTYANGSTLEVAAISPQ